VCGGERERKRGERMFVCVKEREKYKEMKLLKKVYIECERKHQ